MTRSCKLIFDFNDVLDGKPWYGDAVMKKLININPEVANMQPLPSFNSIAKIVQHMINWRIFTIKKMQGDEAFDIRQDDENDWIEVHISSQEDWDLLVHKLWATQLEIIELISSKSEIFFDEKVSGRDYNFSFLLSGIVQHDVYHLGQIALIKKWSEKING